MKFSTTKSPLVNVSVLAAVFMMGVFGVSAQTTPENLELGKPLLRQVKGGESQSFQLRVKRGHFARVEVEQHDIDVTVILFGADGKLVVEMNGQYGHLWRESLSALAGNADANFQVVVRAFGSEQQSGSFAIKLTELRPEVARDHRRLEAEQHLAQGRELYLQAKAPAEMEGVEKEYNLALNIWREIGDKYWEAVTLSNLGWTSWSAGQIEKSVDSQSQALKIYQQLNDRTGEGKAANGLGLAYQGAKQFEKSEQFFEEALAARRELKDTRGEGVTLSNIGDLHIAAGDFSKAVPFYEASLATRIETHDLDGEATTLINLSGTFLKLKQFQNEADYLEKAILVYRELRNRDGEGITLYLLGTVYDNLSLFDKARSFYEQALIIAKELANKRRQGNILSGIADDDLRLGDLDKAKDYADHALVLNRESKDGFGESETLDILGLIYLRLFQYEKAVDAYERELAKTRELSDRPGESRVLSNLGSLYFIMDQNDKDKAREFAEQGLAIAREIKDRNDESYALITLAGISSRSLEYDSAQMYGEQALAIRREQHDRAQEANYLESLGGIYVASSQFEKATATFNQALVISQELNDRRGESQALNNLGMVSMFSGQVEKIREYSEKALAIATEIRDRTNQQIAANGLAFVYSKEGQYEKARTYYEQSLAIAKEQNNRRAEGTTLRSLGDISSSLSEYDKAGDYYQKALLISRETRNRIGEMSALDSVGGNAAVMGHFDEALDNYRQAMVIAKDLKIQLMEYDLLVNTGYVYLSLNEYDQARDYLEQGVAMNKLLKFQFSRPNELLAAGIAYADLNDFGKAASLYQQSLAIIKELKDRRNEGVLLNSLGNSYLGSKQYDQAEDYFNQSLAIAREVKNHNDEAGALIGLGETYVNTERYDQARRFYEQALTLANDIKSRANEGSALNGLGESYRKSNQFAKADEYYQQALAAAREVNSKKLEGKILWNLMESAKKQKSLRLAIFYGKQAINAFQSIRGNIHSFEKGTQQSYLADKEEAYRTLADLLIAEDRIPEAEQVLAMLKEDELSEYVRGNGDPTGNTKTKVELSPDEKKAFDRYLEIADQITKLGQEYGELDAKRVAQNGTLTEPDLRRWTELDGEVKEANATFDSYLKELEAQFRVEVTHDERVTQLSDTQGLLDALNQPRTVIISTIAGTDHLNLIVTTAKVSRAHTVDISSEKLSKLVEDFRAAVTDPKVDPKPAGKKLYDKLFPPALLRDLAGANPDTIVWSLDGPLRYAPIAAIWDGDHYLAERFANVVITLASRDNLKTVPSDRHNWTALGVGVSKAYEGFPALLAVPRELCSVINDPLKASYCAALNGGRTGVLDGVELPDEEFTLAAFKLKLGAYPVVHIASHFSLNPGNETDSFLLLGGTDKGEKRRLTIADARSGLNFKGVELLTISACNTAMGIGNQASGAEIESFGAVAQKRGAMSVLASLWSVADQSTQLLMSEFYRLLKENPQLSKAEALRQAQLSMLAGKLQAPPTGGPSRSTDELPNANQQPPDYRHPYYWSPFVLIGNWR